MSYKNSFLRLSSHTFSNLGFIKSRGYHSKAHNLGFHIDIYKAELECEMVEKPHSRLPVVFSKCVLLAIKAAPAKTSANDG